MSELAERVKMLSKTFDYEGKKFSVEVEFAALCCSYVFKKDEVLTVRTHKTPNRLLVVRKNSSLHKIKRSTLNRCCILMVDLDPRENKMGGKT